MALIPSGTIDPNQSEFLKTYPVASGVTVTKNDAVYFSSGRVTNATIAGARLVGVATSTVTGNAGGTNKVIVTVAPDNLYLADFSAAPAATSLGQYFNLQGTTGAQVVNNASLSATTGQVILIEYGTDLAPAGSTKGVVMFAQHAYNL